MKTFKLIWILALTFLVSCSSFKAERVDSDESDEKALEITDEWVQRDTERVVTDVVGRIEKHKGFRRYLRKLGRTPRVFISQVKNLTSDAYFPINDVNDELLDRLSESGDFELIDESARERILKEITYQHDGMVDPSTAKRVGKQTGADILIFGNVYMKPQQRKGKTIKQYSVNIRMTDLERGVEVMRARTKTSKYSKRSGSGW